MQKTMKILGWYNLFLSGLFIILNLYYLATGSAKFMMGVFLPLIPVFLFMIFFLLGRRIFMKALAWYTLIFGALSLYVYAVNSTISMWTISTVIMLAPLVIFSTIYLLFRRMDIEDRLETFYLDLFKNMGMSKWQSYTSTQGMLKLCKETAQKEETLKLPTNYGDILLEKEKSDEKIKHDLNKIRKEGVRDQDIQTWWNQHDLERRMMLAFDDISKTAVVLKLKDEDKMSMEEAMKRVRKIFPMYGEPDDTSNSSGDDRPIPYELKWRIIDYIEKRNRDDKENYQKDMEESSSYNALIRREIQLGNL